MEYSSVLSAQGKHFALVGARVNLFITKELVAGAKACVVQHGGMEPDLFWVPGSLELAFIARTLIQKQKYHGICCLGAVIKGETDHYEHVAQGAASSIAALARESDVPVTFGVLTTHTVEEALNRAGIKKGNAGYDAALAVIELSSMLDQIEKLK